MSETWRKLYLQAIKKLPDNFIDEETRITTFEGNVYAANPKFCPMVFYESKNEWEDMKFVDKQS